MTYLVLDAVFLAAAAAVAIAAAARGRLRAPMVASIAIALVIVFVLTAVFDNIMIAAGLFTYAADRISGLRLGLAPIEDFGYPVAAAILLPSLWSLFGGTEGSSDD